MTSDAPAINRDEYNKVVKNAELVDVAMTRSEFIVKPEFFDEPSSASGIKLRYSHTFRSAEERGEFLVGLISFEVRGLDGNRLRLKCFAEYNIVFQLERPYEATAAEEFCSHIARFAVYPYFRQYVASMSWASGIDLPVMPIIKQMPTNNKAMSAKSTG